MPKHIDIWKISGMMYKKLFILVVSMGQGLTSLYYLYSYYEHVPFGLKNIF